MDKLVAFFHVGIENPVIASDFMSVFVSLLKLHVNSSSFRLILR